MLDAGFCSVLLVVAAAFELVATVVLLVVFCVGEGSKLEA